MGTSGRFFLSVLVPGRCAAGSPRVAALMDLLGHFQGNGDLACACAVVELLDVCVGWMQQRRPALPAGPLASMSVEDTENGEVLKRARFAVVSPLLA